MDEAGAVEQHVDAADLGKSGFDCIVAQHVEPPGDDPFVAVELGQRHLVDIGGVDGCAGGCEGERACAAYALRGRGDDDGLAVQ